MYYLTYIILIDIYFIYHIMYNIFLIIMDDLYNFLFFLILLKIKIIFMLFIIIYLYNIFLNNILNKFIFIRLNMFMLNYFQPVFLRLEELLYVVFNYLLRYLMLFIIFIRIFQVGFVLYQNFIIVIFFQLRILVYLNYLIFFLEFNIIFYNIKNYLLYFFFL